jgi:uncharacterized protein (DUF1778 family)
MTSDAEAFKALRPQKIVLSSEKFDEFMALLDAPPKDDPKLRKLLTERTVLDLTDL